MATNPDRQRETDFELRWLAPCMFYLSLTFLGLLATMMVLWLDVPRVAEAAIDLQPGEDAAPLSSYEVAFQAHALRWGRYCGITLLVIWAVFILEQLFHVCRTKWGQSLTTKHPHSLLFCLIPPLRLCALRGNGEKQVWMPIGGWQVVDRKLRRQLERAFSIPMIWIALLILPVLALQIFFKHRIVEYPTLRCVLHFGTGLIWFAFAVEFIVMVSVAKKKFVYCKTHWLDLVIILLPLVSFLRTLRLLRVSSLLKVSRLNQLTRVVRVYRLRGVALRGLRALLLLEVLHRLLRTKPEKRVLKLEQQFQEKQLELQELRDEINRLKDDMKDEG